MLYPNLSALSVAHSFSSRNTEGNELTGSDEWCVTLPPATFAPTEKPEPGDCVDYDQFLDSWGDGCTWYQDNDAEGCPEYGDYADGSDIAASEACCYCGGGSIAD